MSSKLHFRIVSPERLLFTDDIEMVIIPGSRGDFGVLPSHSPMVSTLRPGLVTIYNRGNIQERVYVANGFAHLTETDCTILAEESIFLAEMNAEMIEETIKYAKQELENARTEEEKAALKRDLDYIRSKLELLRRVNQ
ncbi:MAG: ATP synthase F1 subunit epsilon [Candidatus Paracaedimonas acanthamoebae]|uniref:ATP synthase epsilon chain n=1 Tax=Candidatus Paracaedimonas acanthamoebae TaxID=244581 RepID=A0A8J7PIR7_9PROT|nr:ATP synthase F1 subunit epsilon [Candidatus Paracaedimonas acanthamoebae]